MYIDPGLSASLNDWSAVRDTYGEDYRFAPDQGVGLCSTAASSTCSKTFKSRILWKFSGLDAINDMSPSNITATTFRVFGSHSYSCTPRPVTLHHISSWNSGTTWPGSSKWIEQSTLNVAHRDGCADQPTRWLEFDALEGGKAVADGTTGTLSLALVTDESSMASWKRYRNDAQLSITYQRAPKKPTGAKFTDPVGACTTGADRPVLRTAYPTIYAVFSDPDGGNVHANVDVYKASDPAGADNILWHARPAAQASGKGQSIKLGGMVNGQIYRVQMNGVDGTGRGGATVSCELEIDSVPPKVPTVTPVAGQPAEYVEQVESGGPTVAGKFTFGNGGSTDVVRYQYSIDDTTFTKSVTSASPTISYLPGTPGSHQLNVRSIDRAGNTSTTRTYEIRVGQDKRVWLFDDGPAATLPREQSPAMEVGASTAWVLGPRAEIGSAPGDRALQMAGGGEAATTSPGWVPTAGTYTASATLRADVLEPAAMTAVSQDGAAVSAFEVGYRPCADGDGRCWSFSVNSSAASATPVVALSEVKVVPGVWFAVSGAHDAAARTLQVHVCRFSDASPVSSDVTSFSTPWASTGATVVGRGLGGTAAPWEGAVADLQLHRGLMTDGQINRTCSGLSTE